MRLTAYTDYSLRVLMYVALNAPERSTVSEIAGCYHVSRNHLVKVAHRLSQLGYLKTTRGRGGGIRLARPAHQINLGRVVRQLEPDLRLVQCFEEGGKRCRIEPSCVLRRTLREALEEFLAVLDGYTLTDLVEPSSNLKVLLTLPPGPHPGKPTRK